jgi:hypothetical protein
MLIRDLLHSLGSCNVLMIDCCGNLSFEIIMIDHTLIQLCGESLLEE